MKIVFVRNQATLPSRNLKRSLSDSRRPCVGNINAAPAVATVFRELARLGCGAAEHRGNARLWRRLSMKQGRVTLEEVSESAAGPSWEGLSN